MRNRDAVSKIRNAEPFKNSTGSFRGGKIIELGVGNIYSGWLNKWWAQRLRLDAPTITYVVWSYQTPSRGSAIEAGSTSIRSSHPRPASTSTSSGWPCHDRRPIHLHRVLHRGPARGPRTLPVHLGNDEPMSYDRRGSKNPKWRGGKATHPLYFIYNEMIQRCCRPTHPRWSSYGGEGITVCDRWQGQDGFWNFVADLGPRPDGVGPTGRSLFSLDRIDNNGNYEPGNVRWATYSEQSKNRRSHGYENRQRNQMGQFL